MSAAGWIRRQRDRPTPESDRRAALAAAVSAALLATTVLFSHQASHTAPAAIAAKPVPAVRTSSTAAVIRVSRAFLVGYLAYTYGQAPASVIRQSTRTLFAALKADPPRPVPGIRARRPRVLTLTPTIRPIGQLAVTATVTDGGIVHYTLGLLLAHEHGRLLVGGLERK